ncbi:endonuclease VII domain-containing protein [Arthrobacter sp. R-11]|uniref:endonuclease VII domain-containing protein n=1 Tax=Arthrobacter sp. R-11 TaxID=3404053 RepID=UPI003CE809D9
MTVAEIRSEAASAGFTDSGEVFVQEEPERPASTGPRACIGPGRNGQQFCGKPTDTKTSELCASHALQKKKNKPLQPLRTRTEKSTCIGPAQDGGPCGRRVYSRPVGQDEGVCKTHYDQLQRRGSMSPIELRLPPLTEICWGPGRDGDELCGRLAEARDTLLCAPHDRQFQKNNGILKPIRKVNTPDGPCIGPGSDNGLCGLPIKNKTLGLCGGHYGQHRGEKELTPLKAMRKRGEVTRCRFPGCRYNDAPGGEGLCHQHWRQGRNGLPLTPFESKPHRGTAVLDRDPDGNKLCTKCQEWKPESDFTKSSSSRDRLNYICRRCQASQRMKAKYGLDLDQYEALLEAQNGCCEICYRKAGHTRLAIDHDHECCPGEASCGKCIRSLLCTNCNQGLGLFNDDSESLSRASAYVAKYAAKRASAA